LVEVIGDRARMVTIANAGHALLPEQPEIVAATVLSWIRERTSRNTDGQNQSSA
jgi:pimeloyl-ACP methyl ester carboxylesterase